MLRRAVAILGILVAGLTSARAQDCSGPIPGPCTLLKYGKAVFVGTVITVDRDSLRRRFRVTEAFKGVKGKYVDLDEYPNGIHFEVGGQYLVFAGPCAWEPHDGRCLTSYPCSGTRVLKHAQAVVEQLRAEKSGRRVASVYGVLWRKLEPDVGIGDENYDRPLADVTVRLESGEKSFETRTDEHGAYAFARLPGAKYQVSADLPPRLAVAQMILRDPVPPFDLPSRSCYEYNIYALPTGRISGRVR